MKKSFTTTTLKAGDKIQRGQTDLPYIKKMSDKALTSNALNDVDNLPFTCAQLKNFKPVHLIDRKKTPLNVKEIREKLNLSQKKFSYYFGINLKTLQDWEQARHQPSQIAYNFLLIVAKEPQAVQRALQLSI